LSANPIPDGVDLILINPYRPSNVNLTENRGSEGQLRSYDMVRSALREGLVLMVVEAAVRSIEFTYRMEPQWEMSHAFLYDAFGGLTYLGTGADIWANLSTLHLRDTKRLDDAMRCGGRALELDPNHPRANLNFGISLAMEGSSDKARQFLERAVELAPTADIRENALTWLNSLEGE
jgi:tetratricopeptide (TPR) repeat protein